MDSDRSFLERFDRHFKEIDRELTKTFNSRIPIIKDIGTHALLGEGKRIRPLLFVLSSRLCGYQGEDVYYYSTMFEYIHNASLLHDDVIDNADMRRNKPSASSVWGNHAAILTGDYLSSEAASIALSTKKMEILRIAIDTGTRMVEGQFLEMMHTDNWDISKEEYMEIIISKTAELMSAACKSGAVIAEAGKEAVENLKNFGLNLGIAFQLVDDLLDYALSEGEFGKPVGKDLREGKTTLPLIYSLSCMDKEESEGLRPFFENHRACDEDYGRLIASVRESGAIERIRAEAKDYVNKAAGFLDMFPASNYKEDLIALNEYIATRNL